MATAQIQTGSKPQTSVLVERWYFTALAATLIAVSVAGFAPALLNPAERRAPLSLLAAAHGIVFSLWQIVFLSQSLLIATRHVRWHRRLGIAAIFILAAMIPLGYAASLTVVKRGFDLSGDLKVDTRPLPGFVDPERALVFPLIDLPMFAGLATAAILYRRRAAIHKRLMLFANIVVSIAPLAHLIGHSPWLSALPPAIIMIPVSGLMLSALARDYLLSKRVHPLTWILAIALFSSGPLRAYLIGPSAGWHHFVDWLAR
jgi:hypothetical protein